MNGLLCNMCDLERLPRDIWFEEGGMCLDCSNEYYAHDHEDCSWWCMAVELPRGLRAAKAAKLGIPLP
jgi:hypothetical protein